MGASRTRELSPGRYAPHQPLPPGNPENPSRATPLPHLHSVNLPPHRKENNLGPIEQRLHNGYICFTGRNRRLPSLCFRTMSLSQKVPISTVVASITSRAIAAEGPESCSRHDHRLCESPSLLISGQQLAGMTRAEMFHRSFAGMLAASSAFQFSTTCIGLEIIPSPSSTVTIRFPSGVTS